MKIGVTCTFISKLQELSECLLKYWLQCFTNHSNVKVKKIY